ncbi:MAG: DNA mismatch repair protein MutS [Kiritimatiellae bacterium]|nr:DNA mismatch repair protein MutS [Kiritimatiellia bacterium]
MAGDELTPMMRQYRRMKQELPEGAVLLFRLGDFYEMFFEDAIRCAPVLGLTLTHRSDYPMCGVPYHALDSYLAKLLRAGIKAAICDQMEDPALAKGIVRREITRIVTPGTITEDTILDSARNNFLAAVYADKKCLALALLDLSTGFFTVETAPDQFAMIELLRRYAPSETLVGKEQAQDERIRAVCTSGVTGSVTNVEDWTMGYEASYELLLRHFQVHSLQGFGCENEPSLICAAGALLQYVHEELHHAIGHIRNLRVCHGDAFLVLDETTCLHLDMIPKRENSIETSLLGVLRNTCTPMGARLLQNWLLRPLRSLDGIRARQDVVELFTRERLTLGALRDRLKQVRDLERLIAKLDSERGNARDANALAASLLAVPSIRDQLEPFAETSLIREITGSLHGLPELVDLIHAAICDDPAMTLKDGGIIRSGYHAGLDQFRTLASEGHAWLAKYQAEEMEKTGIKTLKVRHNKVFGYYIEVSKGQLSLVPPYYERRQTLVNCERFITPDLKEYEQKIFGATEKSQALEYELFCEIRTRIAEHTAEIQETAQAVAQLDTLLAFADRALALGYVRPRMTDGDTLRIKDGRHPVIEQLPDAEPFVPNDTLLDNTTNQIMLITGPNMAGKSTYIRQVALIAVMAHMGSFVPAREAEIPLLDRVFTRVGAGDDLARGRSTFMVEMQETANILNNATKKSLIVLDEIGRGTSTFDGISIAWAVAEYLHNTPSVKAKTLFATHYHELTDLSLTLAGVRNYTVQVREHGDTVVFLRRIAPGTADKSYGIQVARLAGMPGEVVARSKEILHNLEEGEIDNGFPKLARTARRKQQDDPSNQLLFNF